MMFEWISTKLELPKLGKLYIITNGTDIALAKFDVEQMQWHFLWHYSVFKPTFMLELIIPQIPNINAAILNVFTELNSTDTKKE